MISKIEKYVIYDTITKTFWCDARYISPATSPLWDYLELYFDGDIAAAEMCDDKDTVISRMNYWNNCYIIDTFSKVKLDVANFVIKKITLIYDDENKENS